MSSDDRNNSDLDLDRRLEALTRRADPDPALWRAIETRIDGESRAALARTPRWRRWTGGLAVAASVAGALAVGAVLLAPRPGDERDPRASLYQLEQTAMQAVAPEPLPTLLPNAPEALMAAWAENQDAILELERALGRDPENRLLLEFLAQARLRQASLVQQGIPHPQTRSIDL